MMENDHLEELEEAEQTLKNQLKNISFETLKRINEESKENPEKKAKQRKYPPKNLSLDKRKSKHAPIERSSRTPLNVQSVFDNEKKNKKSRDPRFDSFSGKVNYDLFKKSYSFIDTMKKDEIAELEKEIKQKNGKSAEEIEKLRNYLGKLKNELHQNKNIELKTKAKKAFSGAKKNNFYAKKNLIKERMLIEKYKSLDSKSLDVKISQKKKKLTNSKIISYKRIKKNSNF